MPSNRKKFSLNLNIDLKLTGLLNITNSITKSTQEYNKTREAAKKSIQAANKPEVIAEINELLKETEESVKEQQKQFRAIEETLNNIRIFPQARQEVNKALSKAKTELIASTQAFEEGLISREDLASIETNYQIIQQTSASITEKQIELARLSADAKKSADGSSLAKQKQLNEDIQRNAALLKDASSSLSRSAGVPGESIRLLNELEKQTLEDGVAASVNAQRDGIRDYFRAISLYFKGENEEAERSITKAIASGKTLKFKAQKRKLQSDGSEGALGRVENTLEQATGRFGSIIGSFASLTRNIAVVISVAGSLASFVTMLVEAGDKSRELKRNLLSGRSIADLGMDLRASADPNQIQQVIGTAQDQFISIFQGGLLASDNTFKLTQEEALSKFNELAGLHVGRLRNSFTAQQNMTKELNSLVEMGIVLNRRWAVSTSDIAQRNTELVNEFGYSETALKSLYGSLEKVTKNSYLSMPRLLGAIQGLADQSPVFGDTLKQTANFYTRLYDTKILGTKEISSYIEKLNGIFQDQNTSTVVVGQLLNRDKVDSFIDVLNRSIESMPTDTEAQRRRKQILQDTLSEVQGIKDGSRKGDAVTIQKIATGLSFVPSSAKQALMGLSVLSSSILDRQIKSKEDLMSALDPTVEELSRAGLVSGDPKFLLQMKDQVYAQATSLLNAGKSVNLRELFLSAIQRERQTEDVSTYDKIASDLKKSAGSFVPPLRDTKNSLDGFLNRFYMLADSIVKLGQSALGILAKIPGLGDSADVDATVVDDFTKIKDRIRQAERNLDAVPAQRKQEATRDLNTALGAMAKLMKDKPNEVKILMQQGPLRLTNNFYLSGLEKGQLPKEVLDAAGEGKDDFTTWALGAVEGDASTKRVPIIRAVSLPNLDVKVVLQQEKERKTYETKDSKGKKVQINIPKGTLLTQEEKDRLDKLTANPNDPRSILLSALHLKYKGNPIFAYVLKSFAENMETTKDYDALKDKVLQDVKGHKTGIEKELDTANKSSKDAYKRALGIAFNDIDTVRNWLKDLKPPSQTAPRVSVPIIPFAPKIDPKSLQPRPAPAKTPPSATAASPSRPTATRVPDVTGMVSLHAKRIVLRLYTTKVDIGEAISSAVSDALSSYAQRSEQVTPAPPKK